VTVAPAFTLRVAGENEKFEIVTALADAVVDVVDELVP
jgi:hypothetical protein